MTGYATASGRGEKIAVIVTVKSVNHRFLDLQLRLPPELAPLEPRLRSVVREHLRRGHVDLNVILEREGGLEAHIDRALVRAYLDAYNRLRADFGLTAEPDLNAVLKVPGALSYVPAAMTAGDAREQEALVMKTLCEALERLDAMRAEEARAMVAELGARLAEIARAAAEIERLRLGAEELCLARLRERLSQLLADTIPPERLAPEAALLVERSDVSEELMRLKSHIQQFENILAGPVAEGEAGKRLDFLLQEMNREATTILSKTSGLGEAGIRITNLGLQVKAEIEKLREQAQNLQ